MEALPPQPPVEALPPTPAAVISEYQGAMPGFSADGLSDPSLEVITVEAPSQDIGEKPVNDIEAPELAQNSSELSRRQRASQWAGKVVKGEAIGTAVDIATMAVGVPLPIREVAGSAIDSKVYGGPLDRFADPERNPSRLRKIAVRTGSVAMVAATGIIAQKFGSEAVDMISDHFSNGVMGDYVTPLTTKFGGMMGMNSAVKKFVR